MADFVVQYAERAVDHRSPSHVIAADAGNPDARTAQSDAVRRMAKRLHAGYVVRSQIVRRHHYKEVVAREEALQCTYIGIDFCRRIDATPTVGTGPAYLAGRRDDKHRVLRIRSEERRVGKEGR